MANTSPTERPLGDLMINRDGDSTWQQIGAARDCACPSCRNPRTGGLW